jgi:hypothetical protein
MPHTRCVHYFQSSRHGPRTEVEREKCLATRAAVEEIDWDCVVEKNYSETNMGCKLRVSSGISWVFENVERAIILEDDCVPEQSFFPYCEELLEKYKNDERLMHISGSNFQEAARNKNFNCLDSYYFSIIPNAWGWATWARAWRLYDRDLLNWPTIKESGMLADIVLDAAVRERWKWKFDLYHAQKIDSWDGQWSFACFTHRGLAIIPKHNLISNIGTDNGIHFTVLDRNTVGPHMPTAPMIFPLIHPSVIEPDRAADAYLFRYLFNINRFPRERLRFFCKSRFPNAYQVVKKFYRLFSNSTM